MLTNPIVRRASCALIALVAMLCLSGCLATKVVTVPVKVAYGAGKLAVKGTAAAARAVVPNDEEGDEEAQEKAQEKAQSEQDQQDPPTSH